MAKPVILINLRRPENYNGEEGARFEIHLGKPRGVFGEAAKPFEAKIQVRDAAALWSVRAI